MKRAVFVREIKPYDGRAEVFRMEPPITYRRWDSSAGAEVVQHADFVLASALDNRLARETYLFPCTGRGEMLDSNELPGSQRNTVDIDAVLRDAGYEVVRPPNTDVQTERTRALDLIAEHKRAAERHQLAPVVQEVLDELAKAVRGEA